MGRDITPRQHHKIDLMYDFIKDTVWVNYKGEQTLFYEYNPQYPQLNFLLNDFKLIKDNPKCDLIEKCLEDIINSDDMGIKIKPQDKLTEMLLLWYNGELDKNFYYSEENERLLIEFLQKGEY